MVSIAVAQLARVEVPAALWRKQRRGELSANDARLLTADFEADYFGTDAEPPRFAAVIAAGSLLDEAARINCPGWSWRCAPVTRSRALSSSVACVLPVRARAPVRRDSGASGPGRTGEHR
jgi:hypothetical protein